MDTEYDVAIVGARVAGASTAMLLARSGLRVALVDRSAVGSDTLSTHALMRAGVMQLHRWGVLDRIVAAGTPAVPRTVFHYGEQSMAVAIKPFGGVEALYAPRRTVLDAILVGAAQEAGVELRTGVSVKDVLKAPDGRVLGITGHDQQRDAFSVKARLTVGADGLRSTIAGAVGAPVERRSANSSGFIYTYLSDLEADGYEWFYRPGITAGLIPTNDGDTCTWVGVPSDRFRSEIAADVPGSFTRLLAEMSPNLAARVAAAGPARRFRSHPGVPGVIRKPRGPGWALVGDAGYYKDPITAHGITDALRDAEVLARAIVDSLGGAVPEALAMAGYQRTRDRLSQRFFTETEQIGSYRWDLDSIGGHLRNLSAAMADEVEYLMALDNPEVDRAAG